MTSILERLSKADYDIGLIRKWDRDAIGSSYRHSITWFRVVAHSYIVSFMILLIVYSLGTLRVAPENVKHFLLSETVTYAILFHVGVGFIIGISWLLVGRYGRNTKSAAIAYYASELDYYKKKITNAVTLPASQVEFHWNNLSYGGKRDAIVAGYQLYCSKKGYSDTIAESFLRILNTDNPEYEKLPVWLRPHISMYSRFYYWDKEKMDAAENALKALAE